MTTLRPALTRKLMPESYFRIIKGPYLSVATGSHKGKRVMIPARGFKNCMIRVAVYITEHAK